MRICSLLPAATEVVVALGLVDELVGVSHECDYPPEVHGKPVLVRPLIDAQRTSSPEVDRQVRTAVDKGQSLYELDEILFGRAQPDLVIMQDMCHVCAVTPHQLQQALQGLPKLPHTLTLSPTRLAHVLSDIVKIGTATGKSSKAQALVTLLQSRLDSIHDRVVRASDRPKVACIEWLDPLYAAGHWVPEMVALAGGYDVIGTAGEPAERITWDRLVAAEPDVVLFMPCGFSIDRTLREIGCIVSHPDWVRLPAVQHGRAFAVDAGSYFSRPGPRLIDGVGLLAALCHPSLFGEDIPPGAHRLSEC